MQYVSDEGRKITGIHLKFAYLVKLPRSCQATLSTENLENTSNFDAWGLTLVTYRKCILFQKNWEILKS